MIREAIDRWLERAILLAVLAGLVFGGLAFGGVRPADFMVLWWLIIAGLGLWATRIWLAPTFRFLWPPLCWAIVPFIAYAAWRYRTAEIEFVARQEFIQIFLAGLLLVLVVNNLYSQESMRLLTLTLVFFGMVVAMYGVYQWLRMPDNIWGLPRPMLYWERASGSFICPNHLAGFLEMLLPLGIALTVTGRISPVMRVCTAYASFVMLVGVAGTGSRGGWVSGAVGIAMLLFFLLRTKGQRWIALGVLIIIAGAGYWLFSRTVAPRVDAAFVKGHGKEIRLRLWGSALQFWKENPWWGKGPGHFDYHYPKYREPIDRTQGRPGYAHNDYVNTLADYGAAGLALALLPVGFLVWSVVRCWPHIHRAGGEFKQQRSNRAAIVLGSSCGIAALLVHSFFDFNMHVPANALLAVTLMALITSHMRFATEGYWFTARWPLALAGTLAIAGCLFYLVPQAQTRSREAALLRRAEKLPDGNAEKIALLRNAFAVQPKNFETAFAIGEQLRALAWAGADDGEARAKEAVDWFQKSIRLNPLHVASYLRMGMSLEWLDRHDEAGESFAKALALDPNHWQTRAMMGWHEFQLDHYKEASEWFLKSLYITSERNLLARTYLTMCENMLYQGKRPGSKILP